MIGKLQRKINSLFAHKEPSKLYQNETSLRRVQRNVLSLKAVSFIELIGFNNYKTKTYDKVVLFTQ